MISGCLTRTQKVVQAATKLTNVRNIYNDKEYVSFIAKEMREKRIATLKRLHEIEMRPQEEKLFIDRFGPETDGPSDKDFSIFNIRGFFNYWRKDAEKKHQEFHYERHKILGNDLAAATFIVYRGGKVRFQRDNEWIGEDQKHLIPCNYNPNYIVEAIDMNGLNLHYEALENILGLYYLKWLSFRGCKYVNDWYLDKISAEYPQLEYLDVSECENVTERGLESLYRMPCLKTLIVTNHYNSAALELTCFMLEDINPNLKVEIK